MVKYVSGYKLSPVLNGNYMKSGNLGIVNKKPFNEPGLKYQPVLTVSKGMVASVWGRKTNEASDISPVIPPTEAVSEVQYSLGSTPFSKVVDIADIHQSGISGSETSKEAVDYRAEFEVFKKYKLLETIRKHIAKRSYDHMYDNGVMWRYCEKKTESSTDYIQNVSEKNIRRLEEKLGFLSEEEQEFLNFFENAPFLMVHATDAQLINGNEVLNIYSRKKLIDRSKDFNRGNSSDTDIIKLANDDFVFFSLEPGNKPKKLKSRFGQTMYTVNFDQSVVRQTGWLSLVDQLSSYYYVNDFNKYLPIISEKDKNKLINYLGKTYYKDINFISNDKFETKTKENGMFYGKDIKKGMALALLDAVRICDPEVRAEILAVNSSNELNKLLNGLLRPEVKVARHFFSNDFKTYHVMKDGSALIPEDSDDFDKILKLASIDYNVLRYCSARLRENKSILKSAIINDPIAILFAGVALQNDQELLSLAKDKFIEQEKLLLEQPINSVKDLAIALVKHFGNLIKLYPDQFKQDQDVALCAMNSSGELRYLPLAMRDNIKIVRASVLHCGWALASASHRVRNIPEVVLLALTEPDGDYRYSMRSDAYFWASEDLQKDPDFTLKAIDLHGENILNVVHADLKQDPAFMTIAKERAKHSKFSLCKDAPASGSVFFKIE